jgi:hypothetical protein
MYTKPAVFKPVFLCMPVGGAMCFVKALNTASKPGGNPV